MTTSGLIIIVPIAISTFISIWANITGMCIVLLATPILVQVVTCAIVHIASVIAIWWVIWFTPTVREPTPRVVIGSSTDLSPSKGNHS